MINSGTGADVHTVVLANNAATNRNSAAQYHRFGDMRREESFGSPSKKYSGKANRK